MSAAEIRARLAKAEVFLKSAETDLASGYWDASVGRAYYAAFHFVVAYLIRRGSVSDRRGRWSHGHVHGEFGRLVLRGPAHRLGRMLIMLYQARLAADYLPDPVTEMDARRAAVVAGEIGRFCAVEASR